MGQSSCTHSARVLLHICCGPCALMPIQRLREEGVCLTGLFYNPNIHPLGEYLRRRETAALTARRLEVPLLWGDAPSFEPMLAHMNAPTTASSDAPMTAHMNAPTTTSSDASTNDPKSVPGACPKAEHGGWNVAAWLAAVHDPRCVSDPVSIDRCAYCYRMRLSYTASVAKAGGFDAFTSSLLYSRMQHHELFCKEAEQVSAAYGVPFLYRDFRSDWQAGIDQSKAWDLYRQNYCGCIYSEAERFARKLAKIPA